tara:strand:- start:1891 stop:2445 length:555 start_codon:yes stop_codon:yes gene_type:complete
MKKYIVETYYTCTFKTVHTLNNLDDGELSKIDQRTDGEVEVIDVKLNNRKTKKIGDKKVSKSKPEIKNVLAGKKLKEKKNNNNLKSSQAIIIGLDKITAKTSKFVVNLNENKQYGPLEIKVLKCGKVKVNNKIDSVAYLQVKDTSKNQNDQVFIFNGWTFSSDPSLTPFDHAIYDLQLLDCKNV